MSFWISRRRQVARLLAVAMLTLGFVMAAAGPSSATNWQQVTAYQWANVRDLPSTRAAIVSNVSANQSYSANCWTHGDLIADNGITNDIWVQLPLQAGGLGYVSAVYLKGDERGNLSVSSRCPDGGSGFGIGGAWYGEAWPTFCGPAAVQIAVDHLLHQTAPNQAAVALYMGADPYRGTHDAGKAAQALNHYGNTNWYEFKQIDGTPTQAQRDLFRRDVVFDLSRGYPIVANLWVPAFGPRPLNYPSRQVFHFVTVVGYGDDGNTVEVMDPAAAGAAGSDYRNVAKTWWMSTYLLTTLIGGRGYAA